MLVLISVVNKVFKFVSDCNKKERKKMQFRKRRDEYGGPEGPN